MFETLWTWMQSPAGMETGRAVSWLAWLMLVAAAGLLFWQARRYRETTYRTMKALESLRRQHQRYVYWGRRLTRSAKAFDGQFMGEHLSQPDTEELALLCRLAAGETVPELDA